MRNPYENINWSNIEYLSSANHWHCTSKDRFVGIINSGLKHLAISNYQPSYPTYPIAGRYSIIESDVPEDIVECPNSEKVNFSDTSMHISCPGSTYESYGHNWPDEVPKMPWRDKFDAIFASLQYIDGGGIVINHPKRSGNTTMFIIEKLLYDSRVLGVEAYSHRAHRDYGEKGYYLDEWDTILSQGYRCYGFFSPDEHNLPDGYISGQDMRLANFGLGRNILLVSTKTEQEALKAYRNGEFFGAYYGDRIKFTNITVNGFVCHFETDAAEKIEFISYSLYGTNVVENDVVTVLGSSGEFTADSSTIFVRAVAHEDASTNVTDQPITGEKLFSQPIMFKTNEQIQAATPMINRTIVKKRAKHGGVWKNIKYTFEKESGVWRPIITIKTR